MIPNVLQGDITTSDGSTIPSLGFVVWWNVRDVEVTKDWFKDMLDSVGLDGDRYAKEHNYRATFMRCLKLLEEQRIIRRVKEDGSRMIYQFTAENLIDDADDPRLEYTPEAIVEIDKSVYWNDGSIANALVRCDEKLKPVLVEMFDKEKVTYRSSDLTRYVQNIFKSQADIVSLRQQGAVYFVPAAYQELVGQVAQVLESVPHGNAHLEFFPVPDVKSSQLMVGRAVETELDEVFQKLETEIQKMQKGTNNITDKWVRHRQDQIKRIQNRIASYADLLGDSAGTLGTKFDMLKATLGGRKIEV